VYRLEGVKNRDPNLTACRTGGGRIALGCAPDLGSPVSKNGTSAEVEAREVGFPRLSDWGLKLSRRLRCADNAKSEVLTQGGRVSAVTDSFVGLDPETRTVRATLRRGVSDCASLS